MMMELETKKKHTRAERGRERGEGPAELDGYR